MFFYIFLKLTFNTNDIKKISSSKRKEDIMEI